MTGLVYRFYKASGASMRSCVVLGKRFDDEVGPGLLDSDFWLLGTRPGSDGGVTIEVHLDSQNYLPDVWQADDGSTYLLDPVQRRVMVNPDVANPHGWTSEALRFAPLGLFAVDASCLFVWGQRPSAGGGDYEHPIARRVAGGWQEIQSPGVEILAMHGLGPDLVYAVGKRGYVGRFDGSAWQQFVVPTDEVLTSVFVASPDEIYAVGHRGSLLEGSSAGWGKVAESPWGADIPLQGVAKFGGRLFLGAGPGGLLERPRRAHALTVLSSDILARGFEVRGASLLITDEKSVVETTDGDAFESYGHSYLLDVTDNIPLRA